MDLNEYVKLFKGGVKEFDKFCQAFLIMQAEDIKDQTKDRTPVDTGALKSSWEIKTDKIDKNEVTIYNPQEYATEIEYGTKRGIKAKNMVTVPINRYNSTVAIRFNTALDEYFTKKGLK